MVLRFCNSDASSIFPNIEWSDQQHIDRCVDEFGLKPQMNMVNTMYGGGKIE